MSGVVAFALGTCKGKHPHEMKVPVNAKPTKCPIATCGATIEWSKK